MDTIAIESINVQKDAITCGVSVTGETAQAFRKSRFEFYYRSSEQLEGIPKSVAVIPLLAQLLPVSWVFNAMIQVESCDAEFYKSIDDFKAGYRKMYPKLKLEGALEVGSIEENARELEGSLALFSGGLDAHTTAFTHAKEQPVLMLVRGADISVRNDKGWNVVVGNALETAALIGSELVTVETNFRRILDKRFLNNKIASVGDTWWHGMQHGIGFLSLTAPIAYQRGIKTVYIASSFTEEGYGRYTCASDPTIDNFVRFFGVRVFHDGYGMSRLDKMRFVTDWCDEHAGKVYLRVCAHRPVTGYNCCYCEKCFRTILGIIALKKDPHNYGFDYKDFSDICDKMHKKAPQALLRNFASRYGDIIDLLRENAGGGDVPPEDKWLCDIELDRNSELTQWINKKVMMDNAKINLQREQRLRLEEKINRLEEQQETVHEQYAERIAKLQEDKRRMREKLDEVRAKNAELTNENESLKSSLSNRLKRAFKK